MHIIFTSLMCITTLEAPSETKHIHSAYLIFLVGLKAHCMKQEQENVSSGASQKQNDVLDSL